MPPKKKHTKKRDPSTDHVDGSFSPHFSVADASLEKLMNIWTSTTSQSEFDEAVIQRIFCKDIAVDRKLTLQRLEASGYFENYLWKHLSPSSSYEHIHSIVLLINEKFRRGLWTSDTVCNDMDKFAVFFELFTVHYSPKLDVVHKHDMATFALHMYRSLDNPSIRQIAFRYVSLQMWFCLPNDRLALELVRYPQLKPHWDNYLLKQHNAAEMDVDATRSKGRKRKVSAKSSHDGTTETTSEKEKAWLPNLILDYLRIIEGPQSTDSVSYIVKFTEFLIDLLSQLPTRRFLVSILDHYHVALRCKTVTISPLYTQLVTMLDDYLHLEVDNITGEAMTALDAIAVKNEHLNKLQQIAYAHYKAELVDLIYSSTGELGKLENLSRHLALLSSEQLFDIAVRLGYMSSTTPTEQRNASFVKQVLISKLCYRSDRSKEIKRMSLFPDEKLLWDMNLIPPASKYDGTQVLALPKLNLQFLTMHDYLLRNFVLYRLQSAYDIRQDISDAVRHVGPRQTLNGPVTFSGWARMATPINSLSIDEVAKPRIGDSIPSFVTCSVEIDLANYSGMIREEWESLHAHDVVFLVCIRNPQMKAPNVSTAERKDVATGVISRTEFCSFDDEECFPTIYGITYVRGGEIFEIKDEEGRILNDFTRSDDLGSGRIGTKRQLRLNLDAAQYYADMKDGCDCYENLNLLIRRKAKENNFHAVLRTIRNLMNMTECGRAVPNWLHEVLLGHGNTANYGFLHAGEASVESSLRDMTDYVDTFLDYQHVLESFSSYEVQLDRADPIADSVQPPFSLKINSEDKTVTVRPCRLVNMGPYTNSVNSKNCVRYTPAQVDAIRSGMNRGLTLCVGPPGSGKSDVAAQIIVNLYHNYPSQKILLVTHSNAALNDLFEKLVARDVDGRHLLRLGAGERNLRVDSENKFSMEGRINWSLTRRAALLEEVQKLAQSLNISGDVGYTCETAEYFFLEHIQSRIDKFALSLDKNTVAEVFPFHNYFSDAPQPLFHGNDDDNEIALSCFRYIKNIFAELADYRAFEILRTHRHRSDYLLTKQARIIAMTCTHAAIARQRLVDLGFKFDSLVMEEAGQVMEIETLIPILLQDIDVVDGCRLQRVILIGDHHQLPPVVKHPALRLLSHLDQSLFSRFIRLGLPTIQLNAQGRSRQEIASLYSWRYISKSMPNGLENLQNINFQQHFEFANAGFAHIFQCIDVPAFQGKGEFCPTPFFYQNLGEAEYVVATYQYMRLIGYPASKITILTSYNGQKQLIRDVLRRRCKHSIFGNTLLDKYQGQQNDYVLLSLVRTESIGHLRDIRRLVVAMSRARLGLYIFCRQNLFAECLELRPVFKQLLLKPSRLELVEDELYPTSRNVQSVCGKVISDVSEMGVFVYNMAQAVVAHSKVQPKIDMLSASALSNDSDDDYEPDVEIV